MFQRRFVTLVLELFFDPHDPVLMLETGARDRSRIDASAGAGAAAMFSELGQHDLAGTGGQRNRFDDAGGGEVLTHGIATSSGEVQALISRYGRRQRPGHDICQQTNLLSGERFLGWFRYRIMAR